MGSRKKVLYENLNRTNQISQRIPHIIKKMIKSILKTKSKPLYGNSYTLALNKCLKLIK